MICRCFLTFLALSWVTNVSAATWYDVNGDGVEGLAETIHSLQVVSGLTPAPPPGTYTNSLSMQFRLIPAGTFIMGSPDGENGSGGDTHRPFWPEENGRDDNERQHLVTISSPYYMQTTEVTQAQWNALVVDQLGGANPSNNVGPDLPVEMLNWSEAASYANWLSFSEGLTPCYNGNNTCSGTLGVDFRCGEIIIVAGCNGYTIQYTPGWSSGTAILCRSGWRS